MAQFQPKRQVFLSLVQYKDGTANLNTGSVIVAHTVSEAKEIALQGFVQ